MFTRVVSRCRKARCGPGSLPRRRVLLNTSESHGSRSAVNWALLVVAMCTLRLHLLATLV